METAKGVTFLLFITALVIFGPFAWVWSLNTLFPTLHLPYTLQTWGAAVFVNLNLAGVAILRK